MPRPYHLRISPRPQVLVQPDLGSKIKKKNHSDFWIIFTSTFSFITYHFYVFISFMASELDSWSCPWSILVLIMVMHMGDRELFHRLGLCVTPWLINMHIPCQSQSFVTSNVNIKMSIKSHTAIIEAVALGPGGTHRKTTGASLFFISRATSPPDHLFPSPNFHLFTCSVLRLSPESDVLIPFQRFVA